MAAQNWQNNIMQPVTIPKLLPVLQNLYPDIKFKSGELFVWSPQYQTVTYYKKAALPDGVWSLIHEVAHADLGHTTYYNDFQLLQMEVSAWERAKKIAKSINIKIDEDHVQDCLDSYRDWLHLRATCPTCQTVSLQRQDGLYGCFNCKTTWKVSDSPLCRIHRRIINNKLKRGYLAD